MCLQARPSYDDDSADDDDYDDDDDDGSAFSGFVDLCGVLVYFWFS